MNRENQEMLKEHTRGPGALVVLRPHHLLCVQGFRGLGYSPEFVDNMQGVVAALRQRSVLVRIEVPPDVICDSCPHLVARRVCSRGTPADRDQAVLSVLKVRLGVEKPWGEWLIRDLSDR